MTAERAIANLDKAIEAELINIKCIWGNAYSSRHEGYAVLKEEVEEAEEALENLQNKLENIWSNIRLNWDSKKDIHEAEIAAFALASEAIQCAAVCRKFLESSKGWK